MSIQSGVTLGLLSKATVGAGTRVALSASMLLVRSVVIQAKKANTDKVFIGDVSVSSTLGISLAAGESISIEAPDMGPGGADDLDLADFYLDSAVNAEGVQVLYIKRV